MNREQLEEFVTYGVVSLPSFLSAAQLQHYRDQAHPQLSAQANNGEDLLDGRGGSKALDLTPSLGELPQVNALIAQIGGGRFTPEVSFPLSVRLLGHRVRYSSMHTPSSTTQQLVGSLLASARARKDQSQVQGHSPRIGRVGSISSCWDGRGNSHCVREHNWSR